MLYVPLVGGWLHVGCARTRSEADFDHANALGLNASEPLDGPGHFVMQPGFTKGEHLAAEALDHADLIRTKDVKAIEHKQCKRHIQRWLHPHATARDEPLETRSRIETARQGGY